MTVRQVVVCSSYHSIGTLIIHRLISTFHLGNQQWQVGCADVEDGSIIRKFTIDVTHEFMGRMACPVEDDGFVNDGKAFELVIGDEGPLWELAAKFLSHIRMAAEEQDAFLWEGRLIHGQSLLPVPDAFRLEFLR